MYRISINSANFANSSNSIKNNYIVQYSKINHIFELLTHLNIPSKLYFAVYAAFQYSSEFIFFVRIEIILLFKAILFLNQSNMLRYPINITGCQSEPFYSMTSLTNKTSKRREDNVQNLNSYQ